jgi:hypothetical protein
MTDDEKEYLEAQEEIVELAFKHIEECEKLEKKVNFGESLIEDSSGPFVCSFYFRYSTPVCLKFCCLWKILTFFFTVNERNSQTMERQP